MIRSSMVRISNTDNTTFHVFWSIPLLCVKLHPFWAAVWNGLVWICMCNRWVGAENIFAAEGGSIFRTCMCKNRLSGVRTRHQRGQSHLRPAQGSGTLLIRGQWNSWGAEGVVAGRCRPPPQAIWGKMSWLQFTALALMRLLLKISSWRRKQANWCWDCRKFKIRTISFKTIQSRGDA